MKEITIRIPDVETAKQFCRMAGKCPFDIDVFYNRVVIDAKSILGVCALGTKKPLELKLVDSKGEENRLLTALGQYLVRE